MTIKRSIRVAERVREEIAKALGRDLRDPRIAEVIVTRVEVPDDLQIARVMIRLMAHGSDPEARSRAVDGLTAASGRLRRQIGEALGLRRVPKLEFRFDEGQDAVDRIEAVLQEIRNDDPSRSSK